MRRFAEPLLWAVVVATAAWRPLAAAAALAVLVALGVTADPRRWVATVGHRLRRLCPWPCLALALALPAVQALAGLPPWIVPVAVVALVTVVAAALLPTGRSAGTPSDRVADGLVAGALAAVAVHLVVALPDLASWASGEPVRVAGAAVHPNVLASSLLLVAATVAVATRHAWRAHAALGSPARRGIRARRRAALAGLAPALLLVLATGSRAAVIGALAGAAAWAAPTLWAASRNARRGPGVGDRDPGGAWAAALAILGLVLVVPLGLAAVRGLPAARLLAGEVERTTVFSLALDLIAQRPLLGHGGAAWAALATAAEPALPWGQFTHAHALPLYVLVHGGTVGLVVAALFLAFTLRGLGPWLRVAHREPGPAAPLLAASAGALAAQALVDVVVIDPAVYLAGAGLIAALEVTSRRIIRPDGKPALPHGHGRAGHADVARGVARRGRGDRRSG